MKKLLIVPLLVCNLISFSLLSHRELDKAVDALDVDAVQDILQKNPEVLTQTEAVRLIDRLSQNKARHLALFFGGSIAGNSVLGTLVGLAAAPAFSRQDRIGAAISIGMGASLIGFVISAFFFPSNKYRMLLTIFSAPLNKEQLKLLGVLQDTITVHHR